MYLVHLNFVDCLFVIMVLFFSMDIKLCVDYCPLYICEFLPILKPAVSVLSDQRTRMRLSTVIKLSIQLPQLLGHEILKPTTGSVCDRFSHDYLTRYSPSSDPGKAVLFGYVHMPICLAYIKRMYWTTSVDNCSAVYH